MYRNYRQDYAFYAKRATGNAYAAASPEDTWRVVTAIGGRNRCFARPRDRPRLQQAE